MYLVSKIYFLTKKFQYIFINDFNPTFQLKVNNPMDLADVDSLVALHSDYATMEPFVDAKYDIHVQKIGPHYKVFMYEIFVIKMGYNSFICQKSSFNSRRKGIGSSWKSSRGSAMLEQVAVTERLFLILINIH